MALPAGATGKFFTLWKPWTSLQHMGLLIPSGWAVVTFK